MWRSFACAVAILCLSAHAAGAQSSLEDRLRNQLRTAVTELRQLQDQQAMLQAQKMTAEQERDALRKELAALRGRGGSPADGRARAALQASVAQYKTAAEQAAEATRAKEGERAQLQAALAGKTAILDACVAKNLELYRVGTEILASYRNFTLGDAVAASEPVLGLYRVKLENLVQDYTDRLYSGQFDPRAVPAPAAASAQRPAPAPAPQQAPQANSGSTPQPGQQ